MRRESIARPSAKEKTPPKVIPPEEAKKLVEERREIALKSSAKRIIDLFEKTHTEKMELSEIAKNLGMFETSITAAIQSKEEWLTIEGSVVRLNPELNKIIAISTPLTKKI